MLVHFIHDIQNFIATYFCKFSKNYCSTVVINIIPNVMPTHHIGFGRLPRPLGLSLQGSHVCQSLLAIKKISDT